MRKERQHLLKFYLNFGRTTYKTFSNFAKNSQSKVKFCMFLIELFCVCSLESVFFAEQIFDKKRRKRVCIFNIQYMNLKTHWGKDLVKRAEFLPCPSIESQPSKYQFHEIKQLLYTAANLSKTFCCAFAPNI